MGFKKVRPVEHSAVPPLVISGPAGLRSDNLAFDLVAFSAPAGAATSNASAEHACHEEGGD